MIKIVSTGIRLDENLGLPTVLHGTEELLESIYGEEGYKLVNYALDPFREMIAKDFKCENRYLRPAPQKMLLYAILNKVGIKAPDSDLQTAINEIKNADIVVNLFAIYYCDNFGATKYSYIKMLKYSLGNFLFLAVAKLYGKKTVKSVSSFGPMNEKMNKKGAKFASKYLWDVIVAREEESRNALIEQACVRKKVYVSPDIANLMSYKIVLYGEEKPIGISISHQIIKQWKSDEPYIDCICELCKVIFNKYGRKVVLIPNEYQTGIYNDINVAEEIREKLHLENDERLMIFDVTKLYASDIKNMIASCEMLISSRYHSCVAALSAGVPTLVIGWHYKYNELLKIYGMSEWCVSHSECTKEKLLDKYEKLWNEKENVRESLKVIYPQIRKRIYKIGNIMYRKERQ